MRILRGDDALRSPAPPCGLRAGDPAALALRDEVPALLDLAQNAVALHDLPEAGDQVLWGFTISKVYRCHERSILHPA